MKSHIIDCCSLLNLYTGWGGISELLDLNHTWHICEAVSTESEYTREYGSNGLAVLVPLSMDEVNRNGILTPAFIRDGKEIEDYVSLATEIDDGEAQALAIAKNRGYVLLTDDRKAITVARRGNISVPTISTPAVLQAWARCDPKNEMRLRQIVQRITILARFRVRADAPEYEWWNSFL